MEDWEAVEAKMVLVEMETEQEMADALAEAIDEVQDVQEVQEDLVGQVELVELVELEVQDHHSHHLPPDPAALAHQGRPLRACPLHRDHWGNRGCPPHPREAQRH